MSIFDRLRGTGVQRPAPTPSGETSSDEQAIERYRYMLRTAPPETIEQAHAEAFERLTPEQRRIVLAELGKEMPEAEQAAALRGDANPQQLARLATRAEIRQPGVMERVFGGLPAAPAGVAGMGAAPGMGGLFAGSFLSSMAGTVLGSMIAQHFFSTHAGAAGLFGGGNAAFDDLAPHEQGHGFTDVSTDADQDPLVDNGDLGGDFDNGFGGGDTFDV